MRSFCRLLALPLHLPGLCTEHTATFALTTDIPPNIVAEVHVPTDCDSWQQISMSSSRGSDKLNDNALHLRLLTNDRTRLASTGEDRCIAAALISGGGLFDFVSILHA